MELGNIGGARLWIFVAGIRGTKTTSLGEGSPQQGEGPTKTAGWILNSTLVLINAHAAQFSSEWDGSECSCS